MDRGPAGQWLAVIVAVCLFVGLGLVVAAAGWRLSGRRVPRAVGRVAATALGLGASLPTILDVRDPISLLVLLAATTSVPVLLLAAARRFDLAGWYLLGAGLPGVIWWGSFALQDLLDPAIDYRDTLVVWFALPLLLLVAGVIGIWVGNRAFVARLLPADSPDPTRSLAIATAIRRELAFGPLDLPNGVSIVAAIVMTTATQLLLMRLGVDRLVAVIASVATFAILGTAIYYRAWPNRLARAWAAHAFLGSWEGKRFRETTGSRVPTSVAGVRRWLERHPETDENRWVLPELLALTGAFDEAYRVIERLPEATEVERFERHAARVHLDIVAGADADIEGLAEAAEQVGTPGSDERLRAVASVAIGRARDRLARGRQDWLEPLLEAQARIGDRAMSMLRTDTWRTRLAAFAVVGTLVILGAELLGIPARR